MQLLSPMFVLLLTRALPVVGSVIRLTGTAAPYHRPDADLVEDEYVVMLHEGHTLEVHFERIGMDLSNSSDIFAPIETINGYRARLNEHTVHNLVRYDPGVKLVEHDSFIEPIVASETGEAVKEMPPSKLGLFKRWAKTTKPHFLFYHPVMISAGEKLPLPIVKGPTSGPPYEHLSDAGKGVDIYILDTGVRTTHCTFKDGHCGGNSRASNFRGLSFSPYVNEPMVAGIAGGATLGLAPFANIINVKIIGQFSSAARIAQGASVLDVSSCHYRLTDLHMAISDITTDHLRNVRSQPGFRGSVINMSFSIAGTVTSFEAACQAAFNAGIPMAAAAGNTKPRGVAAFKAPCKFTDTTICVAASDQSYRAATFSNFGAFVHIIAPGVDITSARHQDDTTYIDKSGTSMATPMVAGVMANFVGFERLNSNAQDVYDRLNDNSIGGDITGFPSNTRNQFLQNGINDQDRPSKDPYNGIPKGQPLVSGVDTNGPTATITDTALETIPVSAAPTTSGVVGFEGDIPDITDVTSLPSQTCNPCVNGLSQVPRPTSSTPTSSDAPPPTPVSCPAGCTVVGTGCQCDGDQSDGTGQPQTIPSSGGGGGSGGGVCDIPLLGLVCGGGFQRRHT